MRRRKQILACLLAVTLCGTGVYGIPAAAQTVQNVSVKAAGDTAEQSDMILHWDMTKETDNKLTDLTGNQHAGVLNGSVEAAKVEGIDVLNLNGGYVDIPDGTIGTGDTEVTINMLVKISENVPASWMWCLGSSNKRYMYFTGCCSQNQGSVMRGGVGCVPTADLENGNGWSYESVINGNEALTANEWQNITVTYKDGGYFTFYKNGVKVASTKLSDGNAGNFTLQDLMKAGDGRDGYMGWSFYTGNDPKFKGSVADFRIYNKELSESEVTELSNEISDMLEDLKDSDKLSDDKKLKKDEEALDIFNKEDLRGNITLPDKGAYDSTITWESSDENVISTKAQGKVPAGVVTRQDKDTEVTLTATLTNGEFTAKKTFVCTVKKAVQTEKTTDYLFAYFPYTSQKQDERIYFGISEDGLNFDALNNGNYVLESTLGTHGLRDPFIIRSKEGDKFYLIATDLTVSGITQNGVKYSGMGWNENQVQGSKSIMVWESEDLVHWSDQRMCEIAVDNAGCTWAPEAYWDDETQQYVVFWASKCGDDNYAKQRVYYATTRDFNTFSDAKVWIEESGSVIDTTVIKVGDYYYRYTKNEAGSANAYGTPSKRIYCERSKSLTATKWELVSNNSLPVSGGQIEGPCIFKINTDDVKNAKETASLKNYTLTGDDMYCLVADKTGATIFPGLSSDITTGNFSVLGTTSGETVNGKKLYSMPEPIASHGTIMPITSEEYDKVMKAYDTDYAKAAQTLSQTAQVQLDALQVGGDVSVKENLDLPKTTEDGTAISWTSSDENVITADGKVTRPNDKDAKVTLTATVSVKSDKVRSQVVTKTFEVTVAAAEKETDKETESSKETESNKETDSNKETESNKQNESNKTPETDKPQDQKPSADPVKVGQIYTSGKLDYRVTSVSKKTVSVSALNVKAKNTRTVSVPATIQIQGQKYKVTAIKASAFKNNKKLKQVTIGTNVKTIGSSAFSGCSKLKRVTIKSKTLKTVGKNVFQKINKKAVIKVPEGKVRKYSKTLKKAGLSKTVKIK